MDNLWSPLLSRLQPYVPGEQPQDQAYVKLNTNENPYGPSDKALVAMQRATDEALRLYPDPDAKALKAAIAKYHGLDQSQVFVGNGSDEVLAFSFMAFFTEKAPIQYPDISYSFYPVYCTLFGIEAETVPLNNDFSIDFSCYRAHSGGIIFPNPNAPTGRVTTLQAIETLLKEHRDTVVVVDEAYIDFGGQSAVELIGLYPNLLVIQTFSKSRSLAGMRIGYAMADAALIEALSRVKDSFNSYPLDRLAQVAGIAAMDDKKYFNDTCARIIATREASKEQLLSMGFQVLPSAANFVFCTHPQHSAQALYNALKAQGVLVRYFNKPRIDQYLRITIGTDEQMQALFSKLPTILKKLNLA
jgi:histidinol-phosphate aminotransferase